MMNESHAPVERRLLAPLWHTALLVALLLALAVYGATLQHRAENEERNLRGGDQLRKARRDKGVGLTAQAKQNSHAHHYQDGENGVARGKFLNPIVSQP